MIEIIKEKKQWDSVLELIPDCDFYHTFDYHQIAKSSDELPILIKYTEADKIIVLPLLIRSIPGTPYSDVTSIYGYPGPITKNITENFDNTNFRIQLNELFHENNIISAFSRLNPYIPNQEICLNKMGEVLKMGNVVNIDLIKNLDTQKHSYRKRLKTHINKSRRYCTVVKASTKEEVLDFMDIYYENMRRVNAKKQYFFNKEYFFGLKNSNDFKTEILLAVNNETEQVIAGAMFIKKGDIVQYHLSGAKEDQLNLYPIKLLIDEMRIIATREGYRYFNLGGGVGNKEDSLFEFKSGFSKDFKQFKLWEYIVDEKIYHDLVKEKQEKECVILYKKCSEYFPCYRCNLKSTN